MKGINHPKNDQSLNASGNESILDVIENTDLSRRRFMQTTVSASVLSAIGGVTMSGIVNSVEAAPLNPRNGFDGIGFDSIPPSLAPVADAVTVPAGYKVEILHAWGDPIMQGAPDWQEDASQDANAQAMQVGMHHDGMHFFAMPQLGFGVSNTEGLLCVNHEYTHEDILHGAEGLGGGAGVTLEKVRKSQAAHGVSISHVAKLRGNWKVKRNSRYGRRITGNTMTRVSGPAAGHALMKSKKFDMATAAEIGLNDGFTAYGTLNNCAHGYTPWGTYLTCEENWNGYFAAPTSGDEMGDEFFDQKGEILKGNSRYGISTTGFGYRWHEVDPRFNADNNPLEPNLFGWVVEIDPFNPDSAPVKRTSMGRFKHESAQVAVSKGNRVAFYMGDDERNEYIYKFVCAKAFSPNNARANRNLLDNGTLYVARFDSTPGEKAGSFRGQWLALVPDTLTVIDKEGAPGEKARLRDLPSFKADTDAEVQALILIKTRQAADAVGATMMDRPEWTALRTYFNEETGGSYQTYNDRRPLELYCTLTNNSRRGNTPVSVNKADGTTGAGSANPPVDLANPRPDNDYGHIIRWREDGNVVTAEAFEWDIFVFCGDAKTTKTLGGSYTPTDLSGVGYVGNIADRPNGSADLGAPDGLWFDQFGRMWVQTDQAGNAAGDWVNIGANCMACADPNTKQVRRFLTGPAHCEVTGVVNTPDGKTMFVGIQHPGEDSPASNPSQYSNWPQSQFTQNSAGQPLPNTPGVSRPRSSVVVITREDGGIIGA